MQGKIKRIKERADIVIIDEAHHFRTPFAERSEQLSKMIGNTDGTAKKVFMLTATPINNSLFDLLHLIEYFTQKKRDAFQRLGISDTRFYFVRKEKMIQSIITNGKPDTGEYEGTFFPEYGIEEGEKILRNDDLFKEVVIQRSRAYAKKFFEQKDKGRYLFPVRDIPKVGKYELAKIYGDLFETIKNSFNAKQPFLELSIYNTEKRRKEKEKIDSKINNREDQVIMLIRSTLLKRMESSYSAFQSSCEDLLRSNAKFLRYYAKDTWEEWKKDNSDFWGTVEQHWKERFKDEDEEQEVEEEDILPDPKKKLEPLLFEMDAIIEGVIKDLDQLKIFLSFIHLHLNPETDDKLQSLKKLLKNEPDLRSKKVIIFTQYRDTARYLYRELMKDKEIEGVIEELDSTSGKNREDIIKRFSPYYNCSVEEVAHYLTDEIRVLISTDVLSEGLNLQDADLMINYDLHWNPVRLMQRIGRIDRRLDPLIEGLLKREKCVVKFWNFLPPDKLEEILGLYERVTGKVLRISTVLGIEGKKLLTPEDDYEALKDFNESYEGIQTLEESLRNTLEILLMQYPELKEHLPTLPKRLFSGKKATGGSPKGLFAVYRFPSKQKQNEAGAPAYGDCRWYYIQFDTNEILEDLAAINAIVESAPDTQRSTQRPVVELRELLKRIEQEKVKPLLKNMNAIIGEKATLLCWLEVC